MQHYEETKTWNEISNSLVFVTVADENELSNLIEKAKSKEIKFSLFREPDIDNALTAITLEPCEKTRKLCSNLKLAFKE